MSFIFTASPSFFSSLFFFQCSRHHRDLHSFPTRRSSDLGPFLAKNCCTSISLWVVTLEALEPFRNPLPPQDPEPLPYLRGKNDFTFDIHLEASLQTSSMDSPHIITRTNFQNLYWSIAQQLAHHAVNGCNLEPGDLLASGTISGATEESRGCMLELTWRGANPLKLPNSE